MFSISLKNKTKLPVLHCNLMKKQIQDFITKICREFVTHYNDLKMVQF